MRRLAARHPPTSPRIVFASVATVLGMAFAQQAVAQTFPARDVRGWTVAASKDGQGCFLTRSLGGDGDTTLLLGLSVDGSNHLSMLNANWSIKTKARMPLSFRMSKGGYPDHPVVGLEAEGKRGFVTNFDAKFVDHFAASAALHVYRGKVPVEQLALDGSGAAVAELRRCVEVFKVKPAGAAKGAGRSSRIPKDPFASSAKPGRDER